MAGMGMGPMGPLPPEMGMDPAMMAGMGGAMGGAMPPMPADPMAGAGMAAPEAAPDGDETTMIVDLLQQLMAKWGTGQPSLGGEQADLIQVLLQLAQAQPPTAQEAFSEVPMEPQMGMMPTEDIPGEEYRG